MLYNYIFFIPIIFSPLYIFNNKKLQISYLFIVFSILAIVVGIRDYSVGSDSWAYKKIFENIYNINSISGFYADYSLEIGYQLYCRIISVFTDSYQIFFLISSLLTMLLFSNFIIKNSNNYWASIIIFLGLLFLPTMNLMRQWLALAIGVNSYSFFKENKKFVGLIIVAISSLFHYSSVVLFVLPFLFSIKNKKKLIKNSMYILVLSIIFPVAYLINIIGQLLPRYLSYFNREIFLGSGELYIKTILYLLITLSIFFIDQYGNRINFIKNKYIKDKETVVLGSLSIFAVIFSYWGQQFMMLHRVSFFFSIFYLISIPNTIKRFKYYSYLIYILLFISMWFLMNRTNMNNNNGVDNYLVSYFFVDLLR